ncbi:MAG TPA: nuclear transport factor 2 family protein [Alphaproteobacteria bacterium]|nr:nuclear transport factor 2 family protein [Alphaproteobacteria bacterium]
MSDIERNKALVIKFFDALSRNDVPFLMDAYADDVKLYTMGNTLISGCFNKEQAREGAKQVLGAFPKGIKFVIHDLTAEGDRVAVQAESHGDHVSGRHYNNKYHFFVRLRDGLITEFKEYMDTELVTEILCGGQKRPAA